MSDRVYQELVVRAAGDAGFAAWARGNASGLLKHYDLTEAEAASLASLNAEAATPVGAGSAAGPAGASTLDSRRSKTGLFAAGGLVAVLAGGGAVVALTNHAGNGGTTAANSGHPSLGIAVAEATGDGTTGGEVGCPGDRLPIAGGFAVLGGDGQPLAAPGLRVTESRATGSGWTVSVSGAPVGAAVRVRAICAAATRTGQLSGAFDGVQGYALAEAAAPAATGEAACAGGVDSGRVPLGGGYSNASGHISRLVPGVLGYEVTDAGGTASVAQAVCAFGSADVASALAHGGLGWQLVTGPTLPVRPGAVELSEAACPEGWHVAGGGYEATGTAVVSSNLPEGNSWRAAASGTGSLVAYAVCVA